MDMHIPATWRNTTCAYRSPRPSHCVPTPNHIRKQAIIAFIGDKSQPDYYGYLLLVGMFCGNYVGTICEAQYFQIISRAGMHIRCALVHVLFRKATSISNQSLKEVCIQLPVIC